MRFYTSYFANIRNLPNNIVPVSICGRAPDTYRGLQYKKLAPKYGFFMEWKKNHDNQYYLDCFDEQVLSKLNFDEVVREIKLMVRQKYLVDTKDIALICYEKPGDFCHRHIVAEWFKENGVDCNELELRAL